MDLYEERARVVVALARACRALGMEVGFADDKDMPADKAAEWPVLFIELPTGQVSWHIHHRDRAAFAPWIGGFKGTWDGHTTEQKYERLHAFFGGARCP